MQGGRRHEDSASHPQRSGDSGTGRAPGGDGALHHRAQGADRIPAVFDYKVLSVLSGSMEPAIRTGDVIIVEPLRPEHEIREGDVITFRAADAPDMLITHRVIGIVSVNGEPAAYVTKGDANEAPDLSRFSGPRSSASTGGGFRTTATSRSSCTPRRGSSPS